MKSFIRLSIALVLTSLPAAAVAQVTQTYQYDANGRLTGVTTSGAGGTHASSYAYDDANNRTYRSQTGTMAYAALLQSLGEAFGDHPMFASVAREFERAAARIRLDSLGSPSAVVAASLPAAADDLLYPAALSLSQERPRRDDAAQ
ncbi:MAG: RHS repeat protein [Brevundimonas sp.]|uniref:RHS repeat domain-containing protein n=1 Tax=Brevundimonas sp. TaxID=1871086 RepID=UPI0026379E0F|nr:RHS repeat domain-containing protein [Brevundimonas sp.]MDI6623262.1 RHS repeat protein [Brevundimonas sp.]MDQ7812453.1 RHS repeat domain-containing protein [Brevundimonas sp.]